MDKYIKLSYDLSAEDPCPPAIPKIEAEVFMSLEENGANVYRVSMTTHSGTHVDAPFHVINDGLKISDFEIGEFVFENPVCLDIPMDDMEIFKQEHFAAFRDRIAAADLLLIRTGFWKHRLMDPERYIQKNPGFGIEAACYLRERFPGLRGIGLDTPSLAAISELEEGMEAHRILLAGRNRRFVLFEDLDLSCELASINKVIALPWFIKGVDSGPCTVMGILG